jgi:hypothetical protein
MSACRLGDGLQKFRTLRQQAIVGRQRLDDYRGNLACVTFEYRHQRLRVIERCDQRLLHHVGRQAGAVGQRRLGQAGSGAQQHRVGVPVVAAFKLQDLRAPGRRARHAQRRHHRFGSGIDESNALDPGHAGGNQFRQLQAVGFRGAQAPAARQRGFRGQAHAGVGMTEDQRAESHAEIQVLAAVDIAQAGAGAAGHETRRAADAAKCAHRGMYPAGRHAPGALEQFLGAAAGAAHAASQSRAKRAP